DTTGSASSFPVSPVAACGGGPSAPNPSSASIGGSSASGGDDATPADKSTSRRSMSTNSPDSGRFDQSALPVTPNRTTRPAPCGADVTSGVPSASEAQVRNASWAEGSASTCRVTSTSAGTGKALKGESGGNRANPAG